MAIVAFRHDPALEILDAVRQSNPVNPLEHSWEPENMHSFPDPFLQGSWNTRLLHLKSGNKCKLSYFSTFTPSGHTSHHHDRPNAGFQF